MNNITMPSALLKKWKDHRAVVQKDLDAVHRLISEYTKRGGPDADRDLFLAFRKRRLLQREEGYCIEIIEDLETLL